jgi:hypothetical protein
MEECEPTTCNDAHPREPTVYTSYDAYHSHFEPNLRVQRSELRQNQNHAFCSEGWLQES